jgi:hypothetical protein
MSIKKAEVSVPCVYQEVWEDGYGARGWKLSSGVADPEIIASTAATGDQIPTSVFVHDVLDHALCGLGASGHRNEAIALMQLASRTGIDPTADFAQMVDEDLLHGRVLGEEFRDFLPSDLKRQLPSAMQRGKEAIACLEAQLGRTDLRARLISRFFEIGRAGTAGARQTFCSHGLDYGRRGPLGLALQGLLGRADKFVQRNAWARAIGRVHIAEGCCRFEVSEPAFWCSANRY